MLPKIETYDLRMERILLELIFVGEETRDYCIELPNTRANFPTNHIRYWCALFILARISLGTSDNIEIGKLGEID